MNKPTEYQFPFERLKVWGKARDLVKEVYLMTRSFPKSELFGLTSQIRRSVISIKSNLAEGSSRLSNKDRAHFYQISYSSLNEFVSQLYSALDLGMIDEKTLMDLREKARELSVYIVHLRNSQIKK